MAAHRHHGRPPVGPPPHAARPPPAGWARAVRRPGGDPVSGDAAYALLEVVSPGLLALVEDGGRPGLGSMGVSPSGAADLGAFLLGARLLGQGPRQAAIECFGGGLVLRAGSAVTVALTGAPCGATSGGRPVGHAAPFLLARGTELRLDRP